MNAHHVALHELHKSIKFVHFFSLITVSLSSGDCNIDFFFYPCNFVVTLLMNSISYYFGTFRQESLSLLLLLLKNLFYYLTRFMEVSD